MIRTAVAVGGDGEEDQGEMKSLKAGAAAVKVLEDGGRWNEQHRMGKVKEQHMSVERVLQIEEEAFTGYRKSWERTSGRGRGRGFENMTLLSPMLFTPYAPGCIPTDAFAGRTFQIYSIKVAELKGFKWPLKVYGVIAARDCVDRLRNPLFLRSSDEPQILHAEDPFLHLTGPSRAVVFEDPIDIEILLRVKCGENEEKRPLISQVMSFNGGNSRMPRTMFVDNPLCTLEVCLEQITNSVQATFISVQVDESLPSEHGMKVVFSALPLDSIDHVVELETGQVVLYDSKQGKQPIGERGFLNLSRNVVSVKLEGRLAVSIHTCAPTGETVANGYVSVTPRNCNTSQHTCDVGGCKVDFTIAWSLLVEDEMLLSINGFVDPNEGIPPLHPSLMQKMWDCQE